MRMLIGDFHQNLITLFVARTFRLLAYSQSLHFSQVLEVDFKKVKVQLIRDIKRMLIGDFHKSLRTLFVARTFRLLAYK